MKPWSKQSRARESKGADGVTGSGETQDSEELRAANVHALSCHPGRYSPICPLCLSGSCAYDLATNGVASD